MGGKEKCIEVIGGKARGKEAARIYIKMDILELGWGDVDDWSGSG
jgi:hypothetical protein